MFNILQVAGDQVVHANHVVSLVYKAVAQMGTQESGGSGDQYAFFTVAFHCRKLTIWWV
jgi:hypothetical protein